MPRLLRHDNLKAAVTRACFYDPVEPRASIGLHLLVGVLARWLLARSAVRENPVVAMRQE